MPEQLPFRCPACGREFRVDRQVLGQTIAAPCCRKAVQLAKPENAPVHKPPPSSLALAGWLRASNRRGRPGIRQSDRGYADQIRGGPGEVGLCREDYIMKRSCVNWAWLLLLLCSGCGRSDSPASSFPEGFDLEAGEWEAEYDDYRLLFSFSSRKDGPGKLLIYAAVPKTRPAKGNPLIGDQILYKLAHCKIESGSNPIRVAYWEVKSGSNPIEVPLKNGHQNSLLVTAVTRSQAEVVGLDGLGEYDFTFQYPDKEPFRFPSRPIRLNLAPTSSK